MSEKIENLASTVTYSPAMVEWMRENLEACRVTKPELVPLFAEVDLKGAQVVMHDALSATQKTAIFSKVETLKVAPIQTETVKLAVK